MPIVLENTDWGWMVCVTRRFNTPTNQSRTTLNQSLFLSWGRLTSGIDSPSLAQVFHEVAHKCVGVGILAAHGNFQFEAWIYSRRARNELMAELMGGVGDCVECLRVRDAAVFPDGPDSRRCRASYHYAKRRCTDLHSHESWYPCPPFDPACHKYSH